MRRGERCGEEEGDKGGGREREGERVTEVEGERERKRILKQLLIAVFKHLQYCT